ncbi:recombinase family protein [Salinicoccus halodurans]|uniref:Resolvase n=1 Tax=Salinicoccus halodurans TaxID=407035 RepID=A0A0F7HHX9_9STAP|nr:recombinase family protein [Salinicoccus halodurans]AKG72866.1 resolvase [Salinicoccus halodurans]SFK75323.1 Helix-turn-helix domain of resolvase [Salinicoccus halodurans]
MRYGYIRPVDLYDDVEEQKSKMDNVDDVFIEAHAHNKKRRELERLFNEVVTDGDTIIVTDLCILADSTKQLLDLISSADENHIIIQVLNIDLDIDGSSKFSFIDILNYISDFQSDVVKYRTRQGMTEATVKGKQMGRPKRSDDNIKQAVEMYMTKRYTLDEIREATNISRATLYRHLDK